MSGTKEENTLSHEQINKIFGLVCDGFKVDDAAVALLNEMVLDTNMFKRYHINCTEQRFYQNILPLLKSESMKELKTEVMDEREVLEFGHSGKVEGLVSAGKVLPFDAVIIELFLKWLAKAIFKDVAGFEVPAKAKNVCVVTTSLVVTPDMIRTAFKAHPEFAALFKPGPEESERED